MPVSLWSEKFSCLCLGKSRRLHPGLKIALFPPWSGKLRRLSPGLEISAISALVLKVASCPPRSRRIVSWSHRLRLGLENCAVSTLIAKTQTHPHRFQKSLARKNAPYLPWPGKLRLLHAGPESRAISALVSKVVSYTPRWQGNTSWSRRLHLGLKSRAGTPLIWKVAVSTLAVLALVRKIAPSPCLSQMNFFLVGLPQP